MTVADALSLMSMSPDGLEQPMSIAVADVLPLMVSHRRQRSVEFAREMSLT